ncbi:TGF-beta-activated kinase 1 and MAP3K7-binding protein 1-like [Contarinia nasturtii]|uniref:TGF-beta-activated kinase 1 and MAP3K7-binding protein 1-like n=1 Tax=Contarinia nasturtii TaxID=265458 RepID=UPI0012D4AE86|nr:TGF-beta-activated kinase 1 and MAP3K7-binding protein 1-like [Contarinia nasturtii]
MRAENIEIHTKSITDELPNCIFTGIGTAINQLYDENGTTAGLQHISYDNSFQCQQSDRMSLYVICSGNGFSKYAKEKLVAEILFGQLNDNTHEDVKDVLRQAFSSLERDYLNWIDECLTQQVQNMDQIRNSNEEATLQSFAEQNTVYGIHIALAFIYNYKLYTCNVGKCRVILCKTDSSNVLRAVQMSAGCEINQETTTYGCESILSRLEIVGPIPLDDSHRFLVMMSSGLCKALQEVHNHEEQNVNRELVQSIVHCFRIKPSLGIVAQSVIEKIMSQHLAHHMQRTNNTSFKSRPDMTLMIRNFNYPMPNGIQFTPPLPPPNKVTFNPVNREHALTNTTMTTSSEHTSNLDTTNSNYTSGSTATNSSNRSEFFDINVRINPYIDFSDYYKNIEVAKKKGTLPKTIRFN